MQFASSLLAIDAYAPVGSRKLWALELPTMRTSSRRTSVNQRTPATGNCQYFLAAEVVPRSPAHMAIAAIVRNGACKLEPPASMPRPLT